MKSIDAIMTIEMKQLILNVQVKMKLINGLKRKRHYLVSLIIKLTLVIINNILDRMIIGHSLSLLRKDMLQMLDTDLDITVMNI